MLSVRDAIYVSSLDVRGRFPHFRRRSSGEIQILLHSVLINALRPEIAVPDPVGTLITERPLGGRMQSPAPGSHRTQRADFPH